MLPNPSKNVQVPNPERKKQAPPLNHHLQNQNPSNYWGKIVGENNIYTKKANRWQLDNRRFLIKTNEGVKWRGVKQNQIGLLKATKKQKGYHWIYNWYLKKE